MGNRSLPGTVKVETQGKTHFWVPCVRQRPPEGVEMGA